MDYEKKYKDALERAKYWANNPTVWSSDDICQKLFPEIVEKKDERIKSCIEMCLTDADNQRFEDYDTSLKDCLAWLEKQGEKSDYNPYKVTIESIAAMVEKYASGDLKDFYDNVKVKCKDAIEYDNTWNEKQSKQKPADKVEPRFKVGDWIVFNNDHDSVYQIEKIENFEYALEHFLGGSMPLSFSHGDMIRAWTIQDAKDGDVLVYKGEIFMIKSYVLWNKIVYHCCYDGKNLHKHSVYYSLGREDFDKIHPATKLQRDLLFSKMN